MVPVIEGWNEHRKVKLPACGILFWAQIVGVIVNGAGVALLNAFDSSHVSLASTPPLLL